MILEDFRTTFRFVGIVLFGTLLPACRPDCGLDAEFKGRLDALNSGTVLYWKSGGEIDYLSTRIRAEGSPDRRAVLFAAYSNTVVNVPIVVTNNIRRMQHLPRGIVITPYRYATRGYRDFVNIAFEKVRGTNTFDHFCLELEIWKRLDRELAQSNTLMDIVARARVEYDSEGVAEIYKQEAQSSLKEEKHRIEYHLERLYRNESEESRRAYDLFRQVVGREACPRYARRAREREERRKCER